MDINELQRRNKAAQAELQKDMEDRRQRRLAGEFDYEKNQQPPSRQMNHGENIVRKSVQPQRSDSDESFNKWFSASFRNHMRPHIRDVNKLAKRIRKEFDVVFESFAIAAGKREKLGDDLRKEMHDWITRKNREFSCELEIMRDAMLRQNSENLTAMKADLLKLLRKDIVAEVMKINKAMSINANVTDIHGKRKA